MAEGVTGRKLAAAAHPVCRAADPEQRGLLLSELEAAVTGAGIEIGGTVPRQVLGTAVNIAQDLFEWTSGGRWRWIEPVVQIGSPLSGIALAEEAYRVAILNDPQQAGLHYARITQLLVEDGVIIRGPSQGRTVYTSLQNARRWFEWVSRGTFRWTIGPGGS